MLPYRREQTKIWDALSPKRIAGKLSAIINRATRSLIKYVRISEAGDFRSKEDLVKLIEVSRVMKDLNPDVTLYDYTARRDLFEKHLKWPDNLVINGSGFMVQNSFTAMKDPASEYVCPMDCRNCNLCKTPGDKRIAVQFH